MMAKLLSKIIERHKDRNLTRKMVTTYLSVIIIPLVLLILLIQFIMTETLRRNLMVMSETSVRENVSRIQENLNAVHLIEKMINSNGELLMLLVAPDTDAEGKLISEIISQSVTIERIISIEKNLFGVKIFANNQNVPERFPIIMHSSRFNNDRPDGWKYNYHIDYLDDVISRNENFACYTSKLTYGKRPLGYLQVEIEMNKMFPFLYKESKDSIYGTKNKFGKEKNRNDIRNFAFQIVTDEDGKQKLIPLVNFEIMDSGSMPSEKMVRKANKIYKKNPHKENYTGRITFDFRRFVYAAQIVPELDIMVVNCSSTNLILLSHILLASLSVFGIGVLCLLLLIVVTKTTQNLLAGVYSIIDGMTNVRNGNLDVHITETGNDEITETQKTFNAMTVQLKNQMQQIKNEQQLITETEMKAMLNQINAHFLYNVLETIRMQALINNDEETSESILVLGKMMRYCLRWRVVRVPLAQELEYITSYIHILNIRNDYNIDLEIDVDEKLKELEIPKMILQPFVENAFFYAIEPLGEDAKIKVYAEVDTRLNFVWLCVQDFGCGMPYSKIAEIQSYLDDETPEKDSQKGSIGLKNIQMRLTSLYGKEYRLQIISKEGEGTLIKVPVPFGGK